MQEGRRKGAEGKRSKGLYVSVLALLLTGHLFGPCCTSVVGSEVAQHWGKAFLGIMSYLLIQNPVEVLQN